MSVQAAHAEKKTVFGSFYIEDKSGLKTAYTVATVIHIESKNMIVLQIDFPSSGPFGAEMTQAFAPLAEDIAQEPGLIWKIWTENASEQSAGGIYLFDNETDALAYLEKHTARLQSFGLSNIRSKIFTANLALSAIDHFQAPQNT